MVTTFQTVDRATPYILPQSIEDWLLDDHLVRFVVKIVGKLDLGPLRGSYAGRGSMLYDTGIPLALFFYENATGVRSSRKTEVATYNSIVCAEFAPSSNVAAAIARYAGGTNNGEREYPCAALATESFSDPHLLASFPECSNSLRFNPFFVSKQGG